MIMPHASCLPVRRDVNVSMLVASACRTGRLDTNGTPFFLSLLFALDALDLHQEEACIKRPTTNISMHSDKPAIGSNKRSTSVLHQNI